MKCIVLTEIHEGICSLPLCVAKVTNIALQSELFLHTWHCGAGFAIRHCFPDYLSLCKATFPTMSLDHVLILPMPDKNLKWVFFFNFPLPDGSEY